MNRMKIPIIFSVGLMMLMVVVAIPSVADAKLYKNHDGRYITERVYEAGVVECSKIQSEGYFDATIDCAEWILTKEGAQAISEYYTQKYQEAIQSNEKWFKDRLKNNQ